MATIKLHGNTINTIDHLPNVNLQAPDFKMTKTDLSDISLADYKGKKIVLNIFPSIDTAVCATSVRRFNVEAAKINNAVVLCVSMDLPFAHARFCGAEGIENVVSLSTFRYPDFGTNYGLIITDGPLMGLYSRAVIIIDENGKIIYTEQVPDIGQEPDYESALKVIR